MKKLECRTALRCRDVSAFHPKLFSLEKDEMITALQSRMIIYENSSLCQVKQKEGISLASCKNSATAHMDETGFDFPWNAQMRNYGSGL